MTEGISPEEFRRIVDRSGLSNTAVAKLLDVHRATVQNYLRNGVEQGRVEAVAQRMGMWMTVDPYGYYSDEQLLQELNRRIQALRAAVAQSAAGVGNEAQNSQHSAGESAYPEAAGGRGRFTGRGGPPEQ